MADRKLAPEEVAALGLDRKVSPEEAAQLGLDAEKPSEVETFADKAKKVLDFGMAHNPGSQVPYEIAQFLDNPAGQRERIRSALSGATFGMAPKIAAWHPFGPNEDPEAVKAEYAADVEQHPVENLAGAMAVPVPGSGMKGVAGVATRVGGQALLTGGARALAAAPGHTLEEGEEGLVQGGVGAAIGEALGKAAPALKNAAGKLYVRAIGPKAGIVNKLAKEGIRAKEIPQLGHDLYEEGLVPWLTKEEALSRAEGRLKELGPEYEGIKDDFERSAKPGGTVLPGGVTNTFDFPQAAAAARPGQLLPIQEKSAAKAREFADAVGQTRGGLDAALKTRSKAWKAANFDNDPAEAEALYNESVGKYRDNIMKQVGDVAGPGAAAKLQSTDKSWGLANTAHTLAEEAVQRSALHSSLSGLEAGVAAAGGGAAGVVKMAAAKPLLGAANGLLGRGAHLASAVAEPASRLAPGGLRASQTFAEWLKEQEDRAKESFE